MSEIDEKEIERRFEAISQFELDPEVTIRDLERTRESLTGQMSKQQIRTKKIWRTIMKSPISKIATAAAIIIVVGVGIHFLGDGSSVAWSQVVEQLSNHTKYKCRQRVVREQGPQIPTMQVYHLNLQQRRQEVEDGSIHIIDMRSENPVTVELYPAEKKAVVTNILGFGPKKDPDIIDMVKRFEQQSTERLGTKNVNGKTLQGFRHKPNEYNDFTVWVDPATKLPVEIELKHPTVGQIIYMDQFAFDFDLDESAFSTDVPDGYEVKTVVHDYRPFEQKEISPEDIRTGLSHTAYTLEKLPWMEKLIIMQITDPLMGMGKAYVIGIQSNDGNRIIIAQGDTYEEERMVWIPKEQLVLETPSGIELYTHPNGSEYARYFLEGFAKANPDFFNNKNLSEERVTRMIVMPDRTILGMAANKQMSDEKLQELVEALKEIKAN
jgi:outer membrane lipoprotein-sorting protein